MAVNPDLIKATQETDEYRNGVSILGDPDDYAAVTMLQFIGFFYMLTVQEKANVEGLESFIRDMDITPKNGENGMQLECTDEDALVTAFTYIVGRTSKDFFENFLKLLHEQMNGGN